LLAGRAHQTAEGGEEALMLEWLLDLADGNIWWWLFVYLCLPWVI